MNSTRITGDKDLDTHLRKVFDECVVEADRDRDELARFRAMFPVLPWDESPITPEVCERLGMQAMLVAGYQWADIQWYPNETMMEVWVGEEPCNGWCRTSGQLAMLVAARRAAT